MNGKTVRGKSRSRSGSAASNSESELTLGYSSLTPVLPKMESMSDHSLSSHRNQRHHHAVYSSNPSHTEKGAIGDGGYPREKMSAAAPTAGMPAAEESQEDATEGPSSSKQQPDFSDPIYRKLSRLNGEINRMHKEELRRKLAELHLHTGGVKEVLKKRLKNFYRRKQLAAANMKNEVADTQYDYLIIIDYEATCQDNNDHFVHEIIEFPAVLVDVHQIEIVGMFREFCKPTVNPKLSEFCKMLTGVNQSEVDNASEFPLVLARFEEWMAERNLGSGHSFAIVTDGPWDIQRFLSKQCEVSGLPLPRWAGRWVNLRKAYCNFYDCKRLNLQNMLLNLGLSFQGRPHCGLDDSKNIARIACHLLQDGCILKVNELYDNRSNHPKPSGLVDTGDGMHSGDFKGKGPPGGRGGRGRGGGGGGGGGGGMGGMVSKKSSGGLETEEEIADLLFYFTLQSS